MLKQLLNSITGTFAAPAAEARPASADPGPYVELLDPIDGGPGIDLTHEDEYEDIQDQIAKRGDIDDSVILGNGTLLLRDRGKDLRVAVFMAYSALRVDGLPATLHVLGLIQALIERFGDGMYPRRPMARRAALEWLCNERFTDPLTVLALKASESTLQDFQRTLTGLNASLLAWPEESRPDLSGLTQRVETWLNSQTQQQLREAVSHGVKPEQALPPMLGAASNRDASVNPKSSLEAWELVRRASAVLRGDPQSAEAGRTLLRAARWSAITEMPPHQGGVTRFAAPRNQARTYLESLYGKAQWQALLDECADLFNEGGGNHLWLDLMYWCDQAYAHAAGDFEGARAQLALDLRGLLDRVPLLMTLSFDDGLPMASRTTQAWVQDILKPPEPTAVAAPTDGAGQVLAVAAARTLKEKGVEAALTQVNAALGSVHAHRERFLLQRLMLRLAQNGGRPELAIGLARELSAQVSEFALARWEPEMAFDVLATLLRLLRVNGSNDEATLIEKRDLHRRLCGLDAIRAAELSN